MRPNHSPNVKLYDGYYPPPNNPRYKVWQPQHDGPTNGHHLPSSSRYPSGSNSYYYSSTPRPPPFNAAAPSPSAHSYRTSASVDHIPSHHLSATMQSRRASNTEPDPTYFVEHLATFAVGRQYGLLKPDDALRKLWQMEKRSAIWAQPLILRLLPDTVSVEDENGDVVEQFPMALIDEPYSHNSFDKSEVYNNILMFVVNEDTRANRGPNSPPTEMHMFQCNRVSAADVARDLSLYRRGQWKQVRGGRRDTGFGVEIEPPVAPVYRGPAYRDNPSPSSNSSESIDMNVNTLNRCFDDIERFVARIQSAALAQKELELQKVRKRSRGSSDAQQTSLLHRRAQMPIFGEYYDIFQKFKLSFNILALVKNYIHDPNAPELVHFLFTPLMVILNSANWSVGQKVADQVVSPLLSFDAIDLLKSCLTAKEYDVWMSLGKHWHTTPEDLSDEQLPPPYRPVFSGNFAPYGYPGYPPEPPASHAMHRGSSAPPSTQYRPPHRNSHRSLDDVDLERVNLEKERIAFERMKILDRERRIEKEEERLRREEERLAHVRQDLERKAAVSAVLQPPITDNGYNRRGSSTLRNGSTGEPSPSLSPRTHNFLSGLLRNNGKVVEVTYDRVKQHEKELTVVRGEYLEVLKDEKNWWECRNAQGAIGFVPHTILSVLTKEDIVTLLEANNPGTLPQGNPPVGRGNQSLSPRPGMMSDDTPEYIKQRQGKRGEFRYF